MVFDEIKEILVEQFDVDADSITLQTNLEDDLGADSLDAIDIVMSIEDQYSMEVPDEVIESIKTVEDIVSFVESKAN